MIALKSVGSAGEWRFLLRDFFCCRRKIIVKNNEKLVEKKIGV